MAGLESARIWVISDERMGSLGYVKNLLEERGAAVELLDLSDVLGRIVRDRSEAVLDTLRALVNRVRRTATSDDGDVSEAARDLGGRLGAALERGQPDLLVVTASRYLRGLDMLSRFAGGEALRVGLLTDYNLSGAWLKGAVNAYIIPHSRLRQPLLDAGVDEARVMIAGPPVPRELSEAPDAPALRSSFGLDAEGAGPTLLALCEAMDESVLDKLVFQMSLVERPYQPIFHAGTNATAAESLRRAARRHGLRARMLGSVPNLHDFIAAAHLVVAEPDSEQLVGTLALDRPLILVGESEAFANQTRFLVEQGVAWHSPDRLRLGADLEVALQEPRLARLTEATTQVGRPTGAAEVVDALALILERRHELSGVTGDDGPSTSGPFEMIGSAKPPGARPPAPAPAGPFQTIGGDPAPAPPASNTGDAPPPPAPAPPPPAPAPSVTPLSAAEAKDELAALIMTERDNERRLDRARRDQEQWRNRLELAREWNEADLAVEAERILRGHLADVERLQEELERVRAQKDKLKARVRAGRQPRNAPAPPPPVRPAPRTPPPASGGGGPAESRFRDMEVDDSLSSLKDRLRREMDEG